MWLTLLRFQAESVLSPAYVVQRNAGNMTEPA
jgi:hypothetical protein